MSETVTNASIRFRLRWRNDITAPRSAVGTADADEDRAHRGRVRRERAGEDRPVDPADRVQPEVAHDPGEEAQTGAGATA